MTTYLVTGGCGFIGSWLVKQLLAEEPRTRIVNLDSLTYSTRLDPLAEIDDRSNYAFVHGDIRDRPLVDRLLHQYRPAAILHLAAESHVDRSIANPNVFVDTNSTGTFTLLDAALHYWRELNDAQRARFRFLNVSTDEVFGPAGAGVTFNEQASYRPSSPYAASKAAANHFSLAYWTTYGLPTLVTNGCNNFGPFQFPEKLIPLMISKALRGEALPVYGDGLNVRDWIYVEDHCRALRTVLEKGQPGESYNIGGHCEYANLEVVRRICTLLDEIEGPLPCGKPRTDLVSFVTDRPGHDRRYAIDSSKLEQELGWKPARGAFGENLQRTVRWYVENRDKIAQVWQGQVAVRVAEVARLQPQKNGTF